MCVRYTLHQPEAALAAIAGALPAHLPAPDWCAPRYNATLTHVLPVVALGPEGPVVRAMRWGLAPAWRTAAAGGAGGGPRLLPNATAEKAATSPLFRGATARRRALVPANGFYEWRRLGRARLPQLFTLRGEEPFAFAGIWEPAATDGEPPAFAILTTVPNALVAPIHDRMPVLLPRERLAAWLGAEPLAAAAYHALTRPLEPARMAARPVSTYVNATRHEGPGCHAPPEPATGGTQTELFADA